MNSHQLQSVNQQTHTCKKNQPLYWKCRKKYIEARYHFSCRLSEAIIYESENGPMDEITLNMSDPLNHHLLILSSFSSFRSFQKENANP